MKEFNFEPSQTKGEGATLEGSIKLRVPSYLERFDIIEKCEIDIGKDGVMTFNEKPLAKIARAVQLAKDFIIDVNLKSKETGEEYKSFDDLTYCHDMHGVLTEIGVLFLKGFTLEKK